MDWIIAILITIASFIFVLFVWYVLDRILSKKKPSKPLVPTWPEGSKLKAKATESDVVALEWPAAESPLGAIVSYIIYQDEKKIATCKGKTLVYTTGILTTGQKYTFKIEAKDEVGYISAIPLQTSIKLKEKVVTNPKWPARAALKITENDADLTINWPEATDESGIKAYRILVDGDEVASVLANIKSHTVHDLSDGDHVFCVEAQNNAGTWSENGLELAYTYSKKDTEAPYWAKNAKLKITVSGKKTTIGWPAAVDDTEVKQYAIIIDNQPPTIIQAPNQTLSVNGLTVGKHTIEVKAFDTSGNSSVALSGEVVIQPEEDVEAPIWPNGAKLLISIDNKNVKIDWPAATDDRALKHYAVTVDNQQPITVPAPTQTFSIIDLAIGKHIIEVIAYDQTGNASTVLSGEVTIEDTGAPIWPKGAKLQITSEDRNVRINWPAATDSVAVKQYKIFLNNSAIATVASNVVSYTISGLVSGNNIFTVQAGDGVNWSDGLSASFIYVEPDGMPPTWPTGAVLSVITKESKITLEWPEATDNVMVTLYKLWLNNAEIATLPSTAQRFEINDLAEGDYVIELKAGDASDNFSEALSKKVSIVYSSTMPFWSDGSTLSLKTNNDNSIIISWPQAQAVAPSKITGYNLYQNEKLLTVLSSSTHSYTTDKLEDGKEYTFKIEAGDSKGKWTVRSIAAYVKVTPLAPVYIAPPIDPTVSAPLGSTVDFIYKGENPMQKDLQPNTLEKQRISVLRGSVKSKESKALENVKVTVLGHPEYGYSLTDRNGEFILAVNGGTLCILNYAKADFINVQRAMQIGWEEIEWLPEIVMINQDSLVTKVDFLDSTKGLSFAGSEIKDKDGKRKARVFFPVGTKVAILNPDGTEKPMDLLSLKITEFTEGDTGVRAMPGELPPTSGYTYAIEVTADEVTTKIDGRDVLFNQEVFLYVDNFLNFPIGSPAPSGYFDNQKAGWVPSKNGLVIKLISSTATAVQIDVDGSGSASTLEKLQKLGITPAEQEFIAKNFIPAQSFWRMPLTHFSIWDFNWPFGPPNGAEGGGKSKNGGNNKPPDCCQSGSIIGVQSQTLGQNIPIGNTPFSLVYMSDRVMGHVEARTMDLQLIEGPIPQNLKAVELEIAILGNETKARFEPKANLDYKYVWDMKDSFGRDVHGTYNGRAKVGYVYDGVYKQPDGSGSSFARPSGVEITGSKTRNEVTIWKTLGVNIGLWDAIHQGFGGWTIDVHHYYDVRSKKLYLGDGHVVNMSATGQTIQTFAGKASAGFSGDGGKAENAYINTGQVSQISPDGTLYVADWGNHRIRKITPEGIITTIAGKGTEGYSGDGGPAIDAELYNPHRVVCGKNGRLFIADQGNNRIRTISPEGIISTVAGSGNRGFSGDGGPALVANIDYPRCLTLAPDGTLYFSDCNNNRIRKIDTAGIITTVVGNGISGYSGDNGLATVAKINAPQEVVIFNGSLYFADQDNHCIRKVSPDGIITTVAGNGKAGFSGDGELATMATLNKPEGFTIDKNGNIYIADQNNYRVRMVSANGIISTFAGNGKFGNGGDNGSAVNAMLAEPHAVSLGHDGSIFISDVSYHNIRKIAPPIMGLSSGDIMMPSEDGSELYIFSGGGRHLKTLDAKTGDIIYEFGYTPMGYLSEIKKKNKIALTIQRDEKGKLVAITDADKETTKIDLTTDGFLAAMNYQGGGAYKFGYKPGGLMSEITYPNGKETVYGYNESGALVLAQEGTAIKTLEKKIIPNGHSVTFTSPEKLKTEYQTIYDATGSTRMVNIHADGSSSEVVMKSPMDKTMRLRTGIMVQEKYGPDPRFGMQCPYIQERTLKTPSGITAVIQFGKKVTLMPNDATTLATYEDTVRMGEQVNVISYNKATNKLVVQKSSGITTELEYQDNRLKEITTKPMFPIILSYTNNGAIAEVSQGTRRLIYSYDKDGNLNALKNEEGKQVGYSFEFKDGQFNLGAADGMGIELLSSADGKSVQVGMADGHKGHEYEFDTNNKLVRYAGVEMNTGKRNEMKYSYNADEKLVSVKYGDDASTLSLIYDAAGRISEVSAPTRKSVYNYAPASENISSIETDNGNKISMTYDGDLVTSVTWQGEVSGTVKFGYDNLFRIVNVTTGAVSVPYTINKKTGLVDIAGEMSIRYDNGRYVGATIGNCSENIKIDGYNQLVSTEMIVNGANLFKNKLIRNSLGKITGIELSENSKSSSRAFSYDDIGRIKSATRDGNTTTYSYDNRGNCIEIKNAGTVTKAIYDKENKLLQIGNTAYSYNFKGDAIAKLNSTTGEKTTYNYDLQNNLKAAVVAGKKIEYIIDGLNRRIGKKIDGNLVQGFLYLNNGFTIAAETDGNNEVVSTFVYASKPNVPDYIIKNGDNYRIITDHLGSPRMVVHTKTGAIAQQIDYDTWGNIISDTNPGFQPFGFAGGLYDNHTRLTRFGYRDYDAEACRWMSIDPILLAGGNYNLYIYVNNDPVNYLDPVGLNPLVVIGVGAIGGLIFGGATGFMGSPCYNGNMAWNVIGGAGKGFVIGGAASIAGVNSAGILGIGAVAGLAGLITNSLDQGLGYLAGRGFDGGAIARGTAGAAGAGLLGGGAGWLLGSRFASNLDGSVEAVGVLAGFFMSEMLEVPAGYPPGPCNCP